MKLRMKVQPRDRKRYLLWCAAVCRDLDDAEAVPPAMVADMCRLVLTEALGGKLRLLCWLVLELARKQWDEWKDAAWWAWHLHIRQRTMAEIEEMVCGDIEQSTGVDVREWPEFVAEEFVETDDN